MIINASIKIIRALGLCHFGLVKYARTMKTSLLLWKQSVTT